MVRTLLSLATAVVILAVSVPAHALTVTNRDKRAHTLAILEQDDEWSATIQPGETLRNLCASPCSIALNPDEESDFEGFETVAIVDGRLIVTQ